ncbi:N-acetylglucosamine-6-phosphate deacetylase [Buchananella hordeovulneris]|uniref:N-acetylglucosamine-6-phosphate deacetylase n=1 Tax=Buchananella hordeovulneris TaxID=52770 RepID=UPI0026DB1017|nr:amidohydrolase family protein [Buchananella hordeovulneris]MDO5081708.1 amidohydrolase family protein [Buchananella hordeovulneris]
MEQITGALRGRIVLPDSVLDDGVVAWAGQDLVFVGPVDAAPAPYLEAAEPVAGYVLPGLVDVHCHGGGSASFPDATTYEEAMVAVREHRRHGTTTLVASTVTAAPQTLRERTKLLAQLCDDGELAGIHWEGPFVSHERCGAQDPTLIQPPNAALTAELLELGRGHVVTMTLAPEKEGVTGPGGVSEVLIRGGALPSFGHTDAGPAETRAAMEWARQVLADTPNRRSDHATITHLFNGMTPLHHRTPGPIAEILSDAVRGGVIVEMVGDGTHLHPSVVRDVIEIVGRDHAVLITDAMAAAGMPDGQYRLGSQDVTVADGVARLTGGDSIAGGTAHLLDVVRTSVGGGVSLVDAVYCASLVGARIIGCQDQVGSLAAGKRADLVVVDDTLHPQRVVRAGAVVD